MSDARFTGATPHPYDFSAVDYRPLTDPDDVAAFRAFKQWAKATKQTWAPTTGRVIGFSVYLSLFLPMICVLFGYMFGAVASGVTGSQTWGTLFGLVPAAALVTLIAVNTIPGRRKNSIGGQWEQWYRGYHFAAANQLDWQLDSKNPRYPGSAFTISRDTTVYEHYTTRSGRLLDIGNLKYVTGSGKSSTTHRWGYMALKLDRRIPHCVLDARSNNGFFGSNMPIFGKDQVLHLEGDFDRHFTLYCPNEYERDALYIFTPDLMALLIDNASAIDVEIVDDWMFVYSTKPWELQNAWTWYRLLMIVHTLGRKTLANTGYYRDERAMPPLSTGARLAAPSTANNAIAPEGHRLQKGFDWRGLGAFGLIMLGFAVVVTVAILVLGGIR